MQLVFILDLKLNMRRQLYSIHDDECVATIMFSLHFSFPFVALHWDENFTPTHYHQRSLSQFVSCTATTKAEINYLASSSSTIKSFLFIFHKLFTNCIKIKIKN